MIVGYIWNYQYLPGWKRLIETFLSDVNTLTGAHEFQMTDFREKDGWLWIELTPVGDVPPKLVRRVNLLCNSVRRSSQFICIECGTRGYNYFWRGEWTSPCCKTHAREKAKNYLDEFRGEGWRLTEDWRLVDVNGNELCRKQIADSNRSDAVLDAAMWLAES